jgi:hypothetical protein
VHWAWVDGVTTPFLQHPPIGGQTRCASDKEEKNLPAIWEHWDCVAAVAPLAVQHPPTGCSQALIASASVAYQAPPAAVGDWAHWAWVDGVTTPFLQHPPIGGQTRCASDKEEKNLPAIWEHWDCVAAVAPLAVQHPPIGCPQALVASASVAYQAIPASAALSLVAW